MHFYENAKDNYNIITTTIMDLRMLIIDFDPSLILFLISVNKKRAEEGISLSKLMKTSIYVNMKLAVVHRAVPRRAPASRGSGLSEPRSFGIGQVESPSRKGPRSLLVSESRSILSSTTAILSSELTSDVVALRGDTHDSPTYVSTEFVSL